MTNLHILSIAVDPATQERLFAGTEQGLFTSMDGAALWNLSRLIQERTKVSALTFEPSTGFRLYAGTHARGVFEIRLETEAFLPVEAAGGGGCFISTLQSYPRE